MGRVPELHQSCPPSSSSHRIPNQLTHHRPPPLIRDGVSSSPLSTNWAASGQLLPADPPLLKAACFPPARPAEFLTILTTSPQTPLTTRRLQGIINHRHTTSNTPTLTRPRPRTSIPLLYSSSRHQYHIMPSGSKYPPCPGPPPNRPLPAIPKRRFS